MSHTLSVNTPPEVNMKHTKYIHPLECDMVNTSESFILDLVINP